VPGSFTAQAFITTDLDDNQITAFHPGAMFHSHLNDVRAAKAAKLGIVSPDGADGMLRHAAGFAEAGVPFVFDPGQALPILGSEALLNCLKQARYCTVNDYEARLMCDKTGRSEVELAREVEALVVTLGAEGSRVHWRGEVFTVPAVKADAIVDPTGCGDAYRAGLLHGIVNGWDMRRSAQLAAVMGAIKIAHRGGQNHQPSRSDIASRYREAFGEELW
jgi:adenosine kinase